MSDKTTKGAPLVKPLSAADVRRKYLLAHLRVCRQAIDEIGTLLRDGHIDDDAAFAMLAELRHLGVYV
jgi:hypothetical protein